MENVWLNDNIITSVERHTLWFHPRLVACLSVSNITKKKKKKKNVDTVIIFLFVLGILHVCKQGYEKKQKNNGSIFYEISWSLDTRSN